MFSTVGHKGTWVIENSSNTVKSVNAVAPGDIIAVAVGTVVGLTLFSGRPIFANRPSGRGRVGDTP